MPNAVSEEFLLTGRREPVRFRGSSVSANFFDAARGTARPRPRLPRPRRTEPGAARVVVVSHGLWRAAVRAATPRRSARR